MAPRRMWPGQFDEVMETISYVYDNAKELQVDNSKIVVAGEGNVTVILLPDRFLRLWRYCYICSCFATRIKRTKN